MSENNVVAPVKKLRSAKQIAQSIKLGNNSQESKRNKKEKMNKISVDDKISPSNSRIYNKYIYITVVAVGLIGIIYYKYKYNTQLAAPDVVHIKDNATNVKIKSNTQLASPDVVHIKAMD